jgi:hypothetical protein
LYDDTNGFLQQMIGTLSNGTWSASEAPFPLNGAGETHEVEGSELVACPAAGSCVAVASYTTTNGASQGLIETDNGLGQTITITSTPPSTATVSGATYLVSAMATSGLPVTISVDASASSVCSINGSAISFVGVGTCVLDANQIGGFGYLAAPQVQQSFTVNQATPSTPTITNLPASGTYGGSFSGLDVSTTGDGTTSISASGACTVSGTTVSYDNGVGTCTLTAAVADGTDYTAATGLPQSFTVNQAGQAITFTSTRPSNAVVGGASYTVTATGGASLNPVTFSVGSSASSVCSISGSTVSSIGAGTCVIDANQGGDADYGPAPQVHQSFTVGQGTQTITFTSTPPSNATVAGPTYTVAVGGGESGKPVLTTIDATSKKVCSISGDIVSFIGAGTCTLDANQAGDANYKAAYQVQQSFKVSRAFRWFILHLRRYDSRESRPIDDRTRQTSEARDLRQQWQRHSHHLGHTEREEDDCVPLDDQSHIRKRQGKIDRDPGVYPDRNEELSYHVTASSNRTMWT